MVWYSRRLILSTSCATHNNRKCTVIVSSLPIASPLAVGITSAVGFRSDQGCDIAVASRPDRSWIPTGSRSNFGWIAVRFQPDRGRIPARSRLDSNRIAVGFRSDRSQIRAANHGRIAAGSGPRHRGPVAAGSRPRHHGVSRSDRSRVATGSRPNRGRIVVM